ncbi:MAG: hypothetical protein JHC33_07510 [Ignisphaera sp.]|nr:hypothetical protein [Ignisphaera sp.]
MALTNGQIPVLANVPNSGVAVITGTTIGTLGSDTNGVVVYTAGSLGGRIYSLTAVTSSTVIVNTYVYILRGSTVIPLGLVSIPLSSGNTLAVKFNVDYLDGVNILGLPLDNTGKRYIPLQGGDKLKLTTIINIAAGSAWVTAHGADYQA